MDLNEVSSANEKKGETPISHNKCNKFRYRIKKYELLDIGVIWSRYMWKGPIYTRVQHIYEHLDMAVCNDSWRLQFPDGFVKVLFRLDFSDHHHLLICLHGNVRRVNNPCFRLESAWIAEDLYHNMLEACWNNETSILQNLENFKEGATTWKWNTFN